MHLDDYQEYIEFCQSIIDNDKTPLYDYTSKERDKNNRGELAGPGQRWCTPREMALAKIRILEGQHRLLPKSNGASL